MSDQDITLLRLEGHNGKPGGRLYYYQGNFFQPMQLFGAQIGQVKKAKREFLKENKELVENDRSHPDYKDLLQLFDEQMANVDKGVCNA